MILVIVLRVFCSWFLISFASGLCWAIACFVAPRVKRWHAGSQLRRPARPGPRIARVGLATLDMEQDDAMAGGPGRSVAPLPRRSAPHTRPAREVPAHAPLPSRGESERA
jgi:hypothetical protein